MNAITDSSVAAASLPTRSSWLRGAGVPGALLLALGLCLGLSGCGQKGPLELPSAAKPASGVAR
ncbi:MAG: lipoprotein [Aquincola sp.]|uniref:LPS translocon maturation chaperone LptM n=1 Tax=uncultured Aquincola sp. TaxID=886556 RepID=UPI0032B252C8|nr:lipoprotein [Aquincola sp.]